MTAATMATRVYEWHGGCYVMGMEHLIEQLAYGVGYELRQLRWIKSNNVEGWLDGYHTGKRSVIRRYLREALKAAPQFKGFAKEVFRGSLSMDT